MCCWVVAGHMLFAECCCLAQFHDTAICVHVTQCSQSPVRLKRHLISAILLQVCQRVYTRPYMLAFWSLTPSRKAASCLKCRNCPAEVHKCIPSMFIPQLLVLQAACMLAAWQHICRALLSHELVSCCVMQRAGLLHCSNAYQQISTA